MTALPPPPPGGRTSIKQAKANFKTRNGGVVTERERKQLERASELERRAWRAKELAKRSADATAQRKKLEQEEKERQRLLISSQRRCDRFGYKSSQMLLGAFFRDNARLGTHKIAPAELKEASPVTELALNVDGFDDEDLDDETLLDALLDAPTLEQDFDNPCLMFGDSTATDSRRRERQLPAPFQTGASVLVRDELEGLCNELDSSTQIARELDTFESPAMVSKPLLESSFSYGSFDFSIEELDICTQIVSKLEPPAQLVLASNTSPRSSFSADSFEISAEELEELEGSKRESKSAPTMSLERTLMPAPKLPLASKKLQNISSGLDTSQQRTVAGTSNTTAIGLTAASSNDTGMTMSQLELFIDDDLKLTQDGVG